MEPKELLKQYQDIGTVEECKEAREKATPKKVVVRKDPGYEADPEYPADCYCPVCGDFFGTVIYWQMYQRNYCPECGQKLEKYAEEKK